MTPEQLIVLSRQQALIADHNLEDTLFVQLTRREIWLVLYGLLWSTQIEPKLEENAEALLEKISEVLDVQAPHWRTRKDGEASA